MNKAIFECIWAMLLGLSAAMVLAAAGVYASVTPSHGGSEPVANEHGAGVQAPAPTTHGAGVPAATTHGIEMPAAKPPSAAELDAQWGYSGYIGPSQWGELDPRYALCKSGKRQSPVDLGASRNEELYPLRFDYSAVPLQVVNNGHTLQANYADLPEIDSVIIGGVSHPLVTKLVYGSELMVGDVPYQLLQVHFHAPSEHAQYGEHYAMEAHLVHKNVAGNVAVVGVFLKRGRENATLQQLLDHVSVTVDEVNVVKTIEVDAAALLPHDRRFKHYSGSLTKPPCSENVNWYVMTTPVEVSDQQVRRFVQLIGTNTRPLQAMHWRNLLSSL